MGHSCQTYLKKHETNNNVLDVQEELIYEIYFNKKKKQPNEDYYGNKRGKTHHLEKSKAIIKFKHDGSNNFIMHSYKERRNCTS